MHYRALAAFAVCWLAACGSPSAVAPSAAPAALDAPARTAQLGALVERYWTESAALTPWSGWGGGEVPPGAPPAANIFPQVLADSLALERRYHADVEALPASALDADARLTYDMFRRERASAIEGFTYPFELLPVNPFRGMPQAFARINLAALPLALSSDKEFDDWRAGAEAFHRWTAQAIVNLRDGSRRGYTVPRVLVDRSLTQLAALGADSDGSPFRQALRARPDAPPDPQRARLTSAVGAVLDREVFPAYRELHDFLQRDYLPRARSSVAWSDLPLGTAWYAYMVKCATESTSTPAQLHALGLAEVDRIHKRLQGVLTEAAFPGEARAFRDRMNSDPKFAPPDLAASLAAYQDFKMNVTSALPALFSGVPRAEFSIRAADGTRASDMPALEYRPRPPNGLISAELEVGSAGAGGRLPFSPAGFLREGLPGHHLQVELQRERTDLPRFRRYGRSAAFAEGWALYATTLGEELGLPHDAETRFDALLAQLGCATLLVTDTGLHAQGWTRGRAIDYLRTDGYLDESAAVDAVDRAVALPAAGTACTVGFLKLQNLRALVQQAQGAAFDVRAFHAAVLGDGAMPLDSLDARIRGWLAGHNPTRTAP